VRTHGFKSHVLLVLAGAAVLLGSLSRPWYARAPRPVPVDQGQDIGDVNGPLNGLFHGMERWVTDSTGLTGWHALGGVGTAIAGLAGLAALCALGAGAAGANLLRDALRWSAFGVVALVAWRVLDPPGPNDVWELRHGALVAAFAAAMLFAGAMPVADAPRRRRTTTPVYTPPPPPVAPAVVDTSASSAPPGS
jgi:hypothetical protein